MSPRSNMRRDFPYPARSRRISQSFQLLVAKEKFGELIARYDPANHDSVLSLLGRDKSPLSPGIRPPEAPSLDDSIGLRVLAVTLCLGSKGILP